MGGTLPSITLFAGDGEGKSCLLLRLQYMMHLQMA